jgi:hypothetical protein
MSFWWIVSLVKVIGIEGLFLDNLSCGFRVGNGVLLDGSVNMIINLRGISRDETIVSMTKYLLATKSAGATILSEHGVF